MIIYTLTTAAGAVTEIKEPVGFDSLKIELVRNPESHGIMPTVSVGELEFYGAAAQIIKNAYNADIDNEIIFTAVENGVVIYSGIIDLATYMEIHADYFSVKCKTGETGVKTAFNSRIDTKVEIKRTISLDGETLPDYPNLNRIIEVPSKEIRYTVKSFNEMLQPTAVLNGTASGQGGIAYFTAGFDTNTVNEINFTGSTGFAQDGSYFFRNESNLTGKNIRLKLKCNFTVNIVSNNSEIKKFYGGLALMRGNDSLHIFYGNQIFNKSGSNYSYNFEADFDSNLKADINLQNSGDLSLRLLLSSHSDYAGVVMSNVVISITQSTGNYFQITADVTGPGSSARFSLIHETFSRLSEIISGLTVKSEWYGRSDSDVNPLNMDNAAGGGALKALITGFDLRKAKYPGDGQEDKKLSLSFKDLFESMNAIDNIGCGFSHENGKIFLRVERWSWFYRKNILLEVNSPNKKTRQIYSDRLFAGLVAGYDKSLDQSEINAIDTFHKKLEFTQKLKTISARTEKLCKFIADPYAIEVTRRQQFNKESGNWKYDENIFVLALRVRNTNTVPVTRTVFVLPDNSRQTIYSVPAEIDSQLRIGDIIAFNGVNCAITGIGGTFGLTASNLSSAFSGQIENITLDFTLNRFIKSKNEIDTGITGVNNTVISPETYFNVRISPHRNAIRHAERFCEYNSGSYRLKYTSGEGNTQAQGKPKLEANVLYLHDSANGNTVAENGEIVPHAPVIRQELVKFEYPLCIADFNRIMENPYGQIVVDDEPCYINRISYNVAGHLAEFELIPEGE